MCGAEFLRLHSSARDDPNPFNSALFAMNVKGPVTMTTFLELLFVAIGLVLFMFVQVAVLAVMWYSAGPEFAFVDDGPMASPQWCLGMLAGATAGAAASGSLLRRLSSLRSVHVLCLVLITLNLLGAATVEQRRATSTVREVDIRKLAFAEAGEYAVSPIWFYVAAVALNPLAAMGAAHRRK